MKFQKIMRKDDKVEMSMRRYNDTTRGIKLRLQAIACDAEFSAQVVRTATLTRGRKNALRSRINGLPKLVGASVSSQGRAPLEAEASSSCRINKGTLWVDRYICSTHHSFIQR